MQMVSISRQALTWQHKEISVTTTTTVLWPFFQDHPGELVPEENFWTLWCKGRLTEADTDHPAGRHSIQIKQCLPLPFPHFLQAGCPSCCPTNSVKVLKATEISVKSVVHSVHEKNGPLSMF